MLKLALRYQSRYQYKVLRYGCALLLRVLEITGLFRASEDFVALCVGMAEEGADSCSPQQSRK